MSCRASVWRVSWPGGARAGASTDGGRVGVDRVCAGIDPGNEKSLRALAKAPGVRRLDDELFELTAEALR